MDACISRCNTEYMDEWLDGWGKRMGEWMDAGIGGGHGAKWVVGQMDGRRAQQLTPVFLPEEPHGQRSLGGIWSNRVVKNQIQLK